MKINSDYFFCFIFCREFCVPKTGGLNVEVFALRVTFSEGTYQVKRGLWRNNFHYCFVHLYSCVHL